MTHARDRLVVLGAFAMIAGAPFLLTRCARDARTDAPTPSAGGAPAEAANPSAAAGAGANANASAGAGPDADAAAPSISAPPPPFTGRVPKDCKSLDRALTRAMSERSCRADTDCTNFNRTCGCAQPVATSAVPKLSALSNAFDTHGCQLALARPCATCTAPPPRACASGKCN